MSPLLVPMYAGWSREVFTVRVLAVDGDEDAGGSYDNAVRGGATRGGRGGAVGRGGTRQRNALRRNRRYVVYVTPCGRR